MTGLDTISMKKMAFWTVVKVVVALSISSLTMSEDETISDSGKSAHGFYNLTFVKYYNPKGIDANNSQCDKSLDDLNNCEFYFKIFVREPNEHVMKNFTSKTYKEHENKSYDRTYNIIVFQNQSMENRIQLAMNFTKFKSRLEYEIDVWDFDPKDGSELQDDLIEKLSGNISIQSKKQIEPINATRMNSQTSYLLFQVGIQCYQDFFGDKCEKYCSPRNDSNGHYNCDRKGNKNCLPGWIKPDKDCRSLEKTESGDSPLSKILYIIVPVVIVIAVIVIVVSAILMKKRRHLHTEGNQDSRPNPSFQCHIYSNVNETPDVVQSHNNVNRADDVIYSDIVDEYNPSDQDNVEDHIYANENQVKPKELVYMELNF